MRSALALLPLPIATLALLAGCARSNPEPAAKPPAPVAVHLVAVQRGDATRSISLPADVLPYQQATLYAKVGGYAKTIAVDKGDAVEAGALLAEIEVPELIADRAKFQAELAVAELDFQRIRDAQKKAPDLVVAQSVDAAKSKYDVARANLERTDTLLGFAKITAPFAGVITKRLVDPGAFIPAATSGSAAQNAALFTLMDFSKVRVQVPVPEAEVPFIKPGLPVKVTVEELPARAFESGVTRYAYALDDATKTMLTEIEMPNPKGELRPGMYATVRITVERKPGALILPADALLVEKTRSSVFLVADGKAKRQTVRTGFTDAGLVEVVEGVKPDERVIVFGKQPPADGQPVTVREGQ